MVVEREESPEQFKEICWQFAMMLKHAARNARLDTDLRFPGPHPPQLKKDWLNCALDFKRYWQIEIEDLRWAFQGGYLDNDRWMTSNDDVRNMVKFMFGLKETI